jgi:hypothetical protein
MKKIALFLLLTIFLVPFVFADTCEQFCNDENYDYGICRQTTEAGFCEGTDGEEVFGFDQCEAGFDRCCCGYGSLEQETTEDNETVLNQPQEGLEEQQIVSKTQRSIPENLFWFLLIVVLILAIANFMTPKKPTKVEEEIEKLI